MIRVALPCLHFSVKERQIVMEHGFMTFPQFIDNKYISEKKASVKWLEKNLMKYGNGLIEFAVAPDFMYDEMRRLKREWPHINWIFPLHSRSEDFSDFEWVGFPHNPSRRDYNLKTFLRLTEGKKRWYLGFWEGVDPHVLYYFDGMDTTLPETYSGKYGKLWYNWHDTSEKIPNLFIPTIEIFEFNVISFKIALLKLFAEKRNFVNLEVYLQQEMIK